MTTGKLKKILLIDQDENLRFALARLLSRFGYEIIYCPGSSEGLQIFHKNKNISLVIIDREMPDVDGITVLKSLKKLNAETPVIVLTLENNPERIKEIKEHGASEVFGKPPQLGRMILSINSLCHEYEEAKREEDDFTDNLSIGAEIFFTIRDASETGCCLRSNFALDKNSIVILESPDFARRLSLPRQTGFPVRVVNCRMPENSKHYELGAEFVGLSEKIKHRLRSACLSVKGFKA